MATIALYNTWANQMPVRLRETKVAVMDYQEELFSLNSQVLTIDSRICNMEDVIGSLQATTQIQEEKISSLDILDKNNEEFLLNVIGIDEEVGALITQRKEEFYALYGYLKPECEKTWMEKAGDWFASVGEWCKKQWDKALLYTTYLMSLEALLLPAVSLFVEGFTVSALKNVMEMPMVFWYPSLIFDELLLDGQAGISKFLNSYDNRVENFLMWNRGYAKNVPIFNLGRCVADIVSVIAGIIGTGVGVYMAFLGSAGGTAGTAVGGGAIAIPVGAVVVDVGVLVAAASVPLLAQGAANFKKDKDEYWKSRLNESRSSGSSGSGSNVNNIIDNIPNNLKQFGKCDEFAQSLVNALDEEGIPYKIIRIDSEYGIYSDKAGMSIGQGYHYGVQVGNMVYDNMTPGGMNLSAWLEDLGLTQGFDSIVWNYTDIIINN